MAWDECKYNKWALVGYKGGLCIVCRERVTAYNIHQFHFDHKVAVNNGHDKSDRWGGAIRRWAPFTDKWFEWAEGVNLICAECHQDKHKPVKRQLLLEFAEVQMRLDSLDAGEMPKVQPAMFE